MSLQARDRTGDRVRQSATGRKDAESASRAERNEMIDAMAGLEAALARAEPGRSHDWLAEVLEALTKLRSGMRKHCLVAESTDGLMAEIRLEHPRLIPRIEELERDYHELEALARRMQDELAGHVAGDWSARGVRSRLRELLTGLRHQQAEEADLIYEALETDIGVCD